MPKPRDPALIDMPLGFSIESDGSVLAEAEENPALLGLLFLGAKGSCRPVDRPEDENEWRGATHWRCSVRTPLGRLQTDYSMGSAHGGRPPTVFEVVEDLSRSSSLLMDFEDVEGILSAQIADTPASARAMLAAWNAGSAQMRRVLGGFAEPMELDEAARLAESMAQADPSLRASAEHKPFGLLEMAVACESEASIARIVGASPPSADELRRALLVAAALEDSNLADMLSAVVEREDLRRGLPSAAPKARAGL